jgi:hypothetical protein
LKTLKSPDNLCVHTRSLPIFYRGRFSPRKKDDGNEYDVEDDKKASKYAPEKKKVGSIHICSCNDKIQTVTSPITPCLDAAKSRANSPSLF